MKMFVIFRLLNFSFYITAGFIVFLLGIFIGDVNFYLRRLSNGRRRFLKHF